MPLYAYALCERPPDIAGLTGLAGETLVIISAEHAVVIAGPLDHAPSPDATTLTGQDAVVRALHDRAEALLPLRFGALFPHEQSVRRAVDAMGGRLGDRFERVKGREQMTLRVFGAGEPASAGMTTKGGTATDHRREPVRTGTEYLARRAAKALPPEIRPLLDALRGMQRDTFVERGRGRHLATVYQLIDRGTSAAYREAVSQAAAALSGLRVRTSGPSPAYAFARIDV